MTVKHTSMTRSKEYRHYCPVARSLEVIGEKWSLLIVRDLLRGPQRFTDLLRCLGGITPKWLTLRLRDLESAGIVERDSERGRREVWYRLTPRGRDLGPVIQELAIWGIDHARRPPLPGEPVHGENTLYAMATYRNRRAIRLPQPAAWLVRLSGTGAYTITWDGTRWRTRKATDEAVADLVIEATPEAWVHFTMADEGQRPALAAALHVSGDAAHIDAFFDSFAAADAAATPAARGEVDA